MYSETQLAARRAAHFAATGRDLHTDIPLSNVALNYRPMKGIADMIMPVVGVPNQSGFVTEFFRKEALRVERSRRAPGTEANYVDRDVGSKQYFCKNYALKTGVTVEDLANADAAKKSVLFDGAAEFVTNKLWLGWEKRVVDLISTSNVSSSLGVASKWNGAGAPLNCINAAIDNVKGLTGYAPNSILFGENAWKSFRRDATVRNLIFGTNNGGGYATEEQVKKIFEVDRVNVQRSVINTGNESQAESLGLVMLDHVLVYYAPLVAGISDPSWAYTYRWDVPGVPALQAERHPYDDRKKSYEVEVGLYQDERVTGADYGFLVLSVNSNTSSGLG